MPQKQPQGELRIEYVPLEDLILLEGNPKLHDLGAIAASIIENGFRDPPIWDSNLNGGAGGIVAGNGRSKALFQMKGQGQSAPRGIATDNEGNWHVPVVFGCDARSEIAAKRFAVDHNNLVLAGGDFTALDVSRIWDKQAYVSFLEQLAVEDSLPLTVDGDDLDLMMKMAGEGSCDPGETEFTLSDLVTFTLGEISISVSRSDYENWLDALNTRFSSNKKYIASHIKKLLDLPAP